MRYSEIISESAAATAKYLAGVKRALTGHPDVIWHQTGAQSAEAILRDGFKTGEELGRGEVCGAIFFTPVFHRDVSYNRDGGRAVYLPCLITGMNIITQTEMVGIIDMDETSRQMVEGGHWTEDYARTYQVTRMMDAGLVPTGVDGVVKIRNGGERGAYALTKDAANRGLRAALDFV